MRDPQQPSICADPLCSLHCSKAKTTAIGHVAPTPQERLDGAGTVEAYRCLQGCAAITRFPRYGGMSKVLFSTRRGRCGEWANVSLRVCFPKHSFVEAHCTTMALLALDYASRAAPHRHSDLVRLLNSALQCAVELLVRVRDMCMIPQTMFGPRFGVSIRDDGSIVMHAKLHMTSPYSTPLVGESP